MRRAKGMLTCLLAMACVLSGGAVAEAAQYRVNACGPSAGYQNHLLSPSVSDSRMSAFSACPNDSSGHPMGMAAYAGIDRGKVPVFSNAMQSFVTPTAVALRHVHLKAEGRSWNGDWTSLVQASTDRFDRNASNLSGCTGNPGSASGCVSAADQLEQDYDFTDVNGFRAVVACANAGGCTTPSTGAWPYTRSYYFIRDLAVTLDDLTSPAVAIHGPLETGHWLRGLLGLTYNASDNTGIRRTQVTVDELGMTRNDVHACDYTYAVPCQEINGGGYPFDTVALSDGAHHVSVRVFDATDANSGSDDETIYVDNHAPAEPASVSVVGGEDWRSSDGFTIQWSNPPSAAPIVKASYELCRSDGSGCVNGSQSGTEISSLANVRVGQPGDYTIRIWLTDAAGNEGNARSEPLHLKFDNVAPAQAAPQHRNGWVSTSEADSFDQEIDPPKAGEPPISGIAGYAITTDGSAPGSTLSLPAGEGYVAHQRLEHLTEGVTTIRARAISGSGVPSPEVGSTDIHVDLTPPDLEVSGLPQSQNWARGPVTMHVTATDSDQLSGMAGGPADQPETFGGFVRYVLDGGEAKVDRGPERELLPDGRLEYVASTEADVQIATDGHHTVTYRGVDVAGNATGERSVEFKIDQTPPELAVFEALQKEDPQLVAVGASDRTSGLADGGKIRMRRIEPTVGSWITLRTTRQDDRYYARIENATLPEGDYQFRATIPDQAGNEATAANDRDGREEVIHITPTQIGPYPTPGPGTGTPTSGGDPQDGKATVDTVLAAAAIQKKLKQTKCKKGRCPKSCKKAKGRGRTKTCTRVTQSFVHDLRVPFAKRTPIKGRLATAAGTAIPGAEVVVLARPTVSGGTYKAEATVRTDANGAFAYTAPARSGRTLDFHFRGSDTYKHADDQVTLRVPAAVTIKVSRHKVRNGKRVRFKGKLRGRPYPPKGKILDLQAYYRHKWRTFATPRASRSGKWTYKYRFEATRGTVLYKFRVRVRPTSDYPYELGYSKVTKVRVVGR